MFIRSISWTNIDVSEFGNFELFEIKKIQGMIDRFGLFGSEKYVGICFLFQNFHINYFFVFLWLRKAFHSY